MKNKKGPFDDASPFDFDSFNLDLYLDDLYHSLIDMRYAKTIEDFESYKNEFYSQYKEYKVFCYDFITKYYDKRFN